MRTLAPWTSTWLIAALAACVESATGNDPLRLDSVTPPVGANDVDVDITIRGSGFHRHMVVNLLDDEVRLRSGFTVKLGEVELERATQEDEKTLTAVVPAGQPAGIYPLSVTRPGGARKTLPEAYEVVERELGSWWQPRYGYRRQLAVTENADGELPAGYSVVAHLDTASMLEAGTLEPSGDDLRVVHWTGSGYTEIDRHLVGVDSASSEVWFATQTPFEGTTLDYFLYYGDPGASAAPAHWADSMGADEPSRVYLAADDFEEESDGEAPDGWVGSTYYRIEPFGAGRVMAIDVVGDPNARFAFAGDFGWTDVAVRARIRVDPVGPTYYGLFVRASGETNFDAVYWGFQSNTTLRRVWAQIASVDATSLSTFGEENFNINAAGTAWHTHEVRIQGQQATFFFDGAQMGAGTLPAGRATSGRVGCHGAYDTTHIMWDDYVVRRYVEPEPTVTVGREESVDL